MSFDRISALAAATMFAGVWIASANAQTAPAAADGAIHLHMPGERTGGETIHLHPIRHHATGPASAPEPDTSTPQPAPTAEPPPPAPARSKASHAGAESGKATIPFSFGGDDTSTPSESGQAPPAPQSPLKTASIPPHAASPIRASDSEHAGLTKRGAVMFQKGALDPSPAQFNGVKLLASDLATALESGASRVQLEAYGGAPGDKSSDARRLSLKRALAVRQLLIDNGVPSNRIDVRAMGGIDDKGPTDRVDVFVRSG